MKKTIKNFRKIQLLFILASLVLIMVSCAWGNQPVVWKTVGDIDFNKSLNIDVKSNVKMPDDEIRFIKSDIENKLAPLFKNDPNSGKYNLNVIITNYDEGSSFARFMLIGLGQMYLYGDVNIADSQAQIKIREGNFQKNYCVGGMIGASATMRNDMTSKVGAAIADALKKNSK